MNTIGCIGIIAVSAVVVAGGCYFLMRPKKKKKVFGAKIPGAIFNKITPQIVEGELKFEDVIGWYKGLSLDPKKDTPFIGTEGFFTSFESAPQKDGYVRLFLGVYGEGNIENYQLIFAKKLDTKLNDIVLKANEDGLVVLQ